MEEDIHDCSHIRKVREIFLPRMIPNSYTVFFSMAQGYSLTFRTTIVAFVYMCVLLKCFEQLFEIDEMAYMYTYIV